MFVLHTFNSSNMLMISCLNHWNVHVHEDFIHVSVQYIAYTYHLIY